MGIGALEETDLRELDLADPSHWDDGPPHALFERMQAECPVHYSVQANQPDEGGFWSVTKFADVHTVTRDFETFSSERRGIFHVDDIGVPLDIQRLQMISMDPPRHVRLKKIVGRAFTPARIAHHEDSIRKIVTHVLDTVEGRESFDLVADVARPIPARVIGDMLGTPPSDDAKLVHWTNVFTAFEDPKVREQWDDTQAILEEIVAYCGGLIEARRENPTDDLLTALMDAEVDGEQLNEFEIALFFILLMAAGNDSTRATYSGIMRSLLADPELHQRVIADPEMIPSVVEEGLRCYPAFAFMARTATREVELGGQTLAEGDRLLLWYLASNRDPEVFEDPHRFDPDRHNREDHQAFGARGRHFCLGAALARLELKVWLEETMRRMPDLQLDGEPTRVRALFLNQFSSIPVRRGG
jgi:cytochrome P450